MNEFIVWDEDRECFIDESQCILMDGTLFRTHRHLEDMISEDLSIFNYIGKTDIEGNKIFADCSIVEFDYNFEEGWSKMIGYFLYDNEKLRFNIRAREITGKDKTFYRTTYEQSFIKNLKIIDTLQENTELLDMSQGN